MRHAAQADHEIGELLSLFELPGTDDGGRPAESA
jgi:hypothetical protein